MSPSDRLSTILRRASAVMDAPYQLIVTYLPGGAGVALRRHYYGCRLRSMGANVLIDVGVHMVGLEYIALGDDCWIDKYVLLLAGPARQGQRLLVRRPNDAFDDEEGTLTIASGCHVASHAVVNAHGGVQIGANSTVAAGARVISLSHHYCNPNDPQDVFPYSFGSCAPESAQALISSPAVIETNAALGTNSVMLPGTTIGRDSWVGAMSVVTRTIEPGSIAVGSPARTIRLRGSPR